MVNQLVFTFPNTIPVIGGNVEVTQTFTDLGSVIHSSAGCEPEVNRRLGRAYGAMVWLDKDVCSADDICAKARKSEFEFFARWPRVVAVPGC